MSFDGPDPQFQQLGVFQEAVKAVRGGCKIEFSPNMKLMISTNKWLDDATSQHDLKSAFDDCLVWYDYACISQPTSPLAKDNEAIAFANLHRAVESIPFYVGQSSQFIALSPPTNQLRFGLSIEQLDLIC